MLDERLMVPVHVKLRDFITDRLTRPWVLWILLAVVTAVIVGTAVNNYREIDRELTTLALLRRETVARLAAITLAEKLGREVDIAVSLATRVHFSKLVEQGKWEDAIRIMERVTQDFPYIDRLFLADTRGTLMADTPALSGVRGVNFAHREWYQGVSRAWQPYVSPLYIRTAQPRLKVIAVAAPIRGPTDKIVGILVVQIQMAKMLGWIDAIDLGRKGFIYIVDSMGQVAFHSKYREDTSTDIAEVSKTAVVQKALRGEAGVVTGLEPMENEDSIVAYASVPGFGWGLITQQPIRSSLAYAAKQQQLERMLWEYSITLLLVMAAVFLAARIVAERRSGEMRFRAVADSANDAIVSTDRRGRIIYFNPAAERVFGYDAKEIHHQPLTRLMPERFHNAHAHGLKRYLETGQSQVIGKTVELIGQRKNGDEFPIELSLSTWKIGTQICFTGLLRDITRRREAEARIQYLNENLKKRALELESINRELEAFSYSVSHDLRAPLRAIDGFSQILLEEHAANLDPEGHDSLRRVRAAAHKMGELIDDMLQLSRVTRSELRPDRVDLGVMTRDITQELRKQQPQRKVVLTLGADLEATGDPHLMGIVLQNLLDNAFKFTSKLPEARISLERIEHEGKPTFVLRDNGVGFDMNYADKLFGAFQRLHNASEFPGTGVGLATVQRIIHRHGGRIWAESQVNRGAAFYFTLS